MPDNQMVNTSVGEALENAELQFQAAHLIYGHGTDNAFDDACVLLRHAMRLPYDADLTQERWQSIVPKEALTAFTDLVKRRIAERIPAPYLTGLAYVQGVTLYTDPRVIIPRSLLGEILFSYGLDPYLTREPTRILDLCTGSGALAIQAAMVYENAKIDAVDIEPAAIELSKRNLALHQLDSQIQLYLGDLYHALPDAHASSGYYDIILSNPPYVNEASMQALPAEYRREPRLALAGGTDGMDCIRHIITNAKRYLAPHGLLVLEIGFEANYFQLAFPTLPCIYLPVTAGDDLIVLIHAADL
jgi:ribosomal protein L3 glutamine methyltransferase